MLKVVVFSGGRGSEVLSRELLRNPDVSLTLAINGYDDGASTGEVRRFLGDSLGPSDYRKNASRLARDLQSCGMALVEFLDLRFPAGTAREQAVALFRLLDAEVGSGVGKFERHCVTLWRSIDPSSRRPVVKRLARFHEELTRSGRAFDFSDCSLGNLVFAGCYLITGRHFNAAVADYCALFRLPGGMIENVTDGTNAYLVALDRDHRLLGTEAEIVDSGSRRQIREIFLLDRPPAADEVARLNAGPEEETERFLASHATVVAPNPTLLGRLAEADLIISAPGTQHSSLFPSYLTPGVGATIARNLKAIKLLITNIQQDAEIGDASAVDIIDRAVYYLREKGQRQIPPPCLITHYLINDPSQEESGVPYVPLGRLDTLEDPRLVRIGHYEDGVSGRHDAAAVLTPFITSLLRRGSRPRVGVLLLETASLNIISQTMLEMLRGGIEDVPAEITVLYSSLERFDAPFAESLPFGIEKVRTADGDGFAAVLQERRFDYFVLFESSGMYRGEDIVNVASLLTPGTLDAVWGSRRLSVTDIRESYKLRYRHNVLLGAVSYVGSHLLSLAYLVLYGRYISDTLSGVRAVRASYLRDERLDLGHKAVNHQILSLLLGNRAGVFETPVQFFSLSPQRARRTTLLDGLQSLATIVRWKLRPRPHVGRTLVVVRAADDQAGRGEPERSARTVTPDAL